MSETNTDNSCLTCMVWSVSLGSGFWTQVCRSCIQSLWLNLGNIYKSTLWPRSRQVRAHLGWSDAGWREESFNWQYKEKFFYRPSNNITDNWATVANIYRSTIYDQDNLVSEGVSLGRSILYSVVSRGIIFQRLIHRIMGRRFPDGGLLWYRKWVPQQLGDVAAAVLSNKGVGTADQWERGTATQQPITRICCPGVVELVYLLSRRGRTCEI